MCKIIKQKFDLEDSEKGIEYLNTIVLSQMSSSVIAIAQSCKSSHDCALAVCAATTTDSLNERSPVFY